MFSRWTNKWWLVKAKTLSQEKVQSTDFDPDAPGNQLQLRPAKPIDNKQQTI